MRATQKQSGGAHVIIVVILIIALLGVLGFVFWQNFINKSASDTQASSETQTTTSVAKGEVATSQGELVLSSSHVKGTYATEWGMSARPMTGGTSGTKIIGYILSSAKLSSDAQDKQGCAAQAGTIQIVNPGDTWSEDRSGNNIPIDQYVGQDAKKVGSHYYVYVDPYACSGDVSSLSLSAADASLLTSYRAASIVFIQSLQSE